MQSLKIIIFRDTDKPYTMIISSGILIGIAFSLIALMSLFTFSVMSNVMFYKNGQPEPMMLAAANNQQEGNTDQEPLSEAIPEEGNNTEDDAAAAEGTESSGEDGSSDDPAYENPVGVEEDEQASNTGEEAPEGEIENTTEAEYPDPSNSSLNTLSNIAPYMPADSEVEAFLLQDAQLGTSSIRVRVQVQKRTNLGQRYRGRFCAALIDNEGNIGPTYPNQVNIEGNDVLNPDKANTFRIAYRRNYDIPFSNVDPQEYSAIVFYLFDEQTKTLQWRNSVPLTR